MPQTATDASFCQLAGQTTSIQMPIGSWFTKMFTDSIDWDTATDHDHLLHDAREDFITARLCELHHLPFLRTEFTIDQLAQLATPQQQAAIWAAMLAELPA